MPDKILLAHGSGGKMMHELIRGLLLKHFNNPILKKLADSAVINFKEKLAFTADSFVVSPLFFPGGDIGKLAICGTVNDLVMAGADPLYLSLSLIIEEGLGYEILEKVIASLARHSRQAGVEIITGDLKVVEKGSCDKLFINTSGIGRLVRPREFSVHDIAVGDKVIVTGMIARHGLAVLARRKELDFGFNIKSDCSALNHLLIPLLKKTSAVKFMRDPTRGGVATTLNEIAMSCGKGVIIEENSIPVSANVRCACELLGIEPLYVANEGVAIIILSSKDAKRVLGLLRKHPLGRSSRIIGSVVANPRGRVILRTNLGTSRILDMLAGESMPRIC